MGWGPEHAGSESDVDGRTLRVEVKELPKPRCLWILHRHCSAFSGQPLNEVEGVARDQICRTALLSALGEALRKIGRTKASRRAATTCPRERGARGSEMDHEANAARNETAQLLTERVHGPDVLEVCSTSCKIIWRADWYACRGYGRREDPSPREELSEQVVRRVLEDSVGT